MHHPESDMEAAAKKTRLARALRRQIFGILILVLNANSATATDYRTLYGKGLEALENEDWLKAADWFQQVIDEKPEAGGKIRLPGQKKKRLYLPYAHLGLALYHSDALMEATRAWRNSALQGALRKDPDMQKRVDQFTAEIDERLAQQTSPPPSVKLSQEKLAVLRRAVEKQLERANQQMVDLDQPTLQAILTANPSLMDRRRAGVEKLRQARRIHEEAEPDALETAHALAVEAAGILEDVVFKATRLKRERP